MYVIAVEFVVSCSSFRTVRSFDTTTGVRGYLDYGRVASPVHPETTGTPTLGMHSKQPAEDHVVLLVGSIVSSVILLAR